MLEDVTIATRGGIILYRKNYSPLRGNPINTVIKEYILGDKTGEKQAIIDNYNVHWVSDNETDTVIIVIHIKTIKVDYIDMFLNDLTEEFKEKYLPNKTLDRTEAEEMVERILKESKERSKEEKTHRKMKDFSETKKGIEISNSLIKKNNENKEPEKVIVNEGEGVKVNFDGMQKKQKKSTTNSSMFSKMIQSFKGTRVVDEQEAEDQSQKIEQLLIKKNVNSEIATQIRSNIKTLLNGKKVDTLTLRGTVADGVSEVLTRIMTPKDPIDIAKDIEEKKANGGVYSIVFLGVNGVGKSTSLSKVSCWLKNLGYKVMIAGCDTFRSGAVDQLEVHAQRLGITLYQEGYDKDPSAIARNALKYAKDNSYDVLLIDTAGRMQGNDALMKAIAKLVHSAQTDLTLFVAEALVGNDAVNQLTTFNRYVIDYAPNGATKKVNGIILTKFDTIDDKVGAAISLTYSTGIPILFVGTGQNYSDLKLLDVDDLIDKLLN